MRFELKIRIDDLCAPQTDVLMSGLHQLGWRQISATFQGEYVMYVFQQR